MPQSNSTLFAAHPATVTVWGVAARQQYTYDDATVAVVSSGETSQEVFLCVTDNVSVAAAPVESFTIAIKLDGAALTLGNAHGGVCILFKDEGILTAFVRSVAGVLPAMDRDLDSDETVFDGLDGQSESSTSDSLLSEFFDSSLSDFLDTEDDEGGLEWEVVDN